MQLLKKLGAVAVALVMATATILPMVSVDVNADTLTPEQAIVDEAKAGITDDKLTEIESTTFKHCYDVQRPTDDITLPDSSSVDGVGLYKTEDPHTSTGGSTGADGDWKLVNRGTYGDYGNKNSNIEAVVNDYANYNGNNYSPESIIIHELMKGTESINIGVIIAYGPNLSDLDNVDTTKKYAAFVGTGFKGYILSKEEPLDIPYNTEAIVLASPNVATGTPTGNDASNKTDDSTTQPTTPAEKPAEPAKDKTPNTGDDSNTVAWMAILMLSGAALAGFGVNRRFNAN